MDKKLMKTSLFGFSKTAVCEYIAKVNDEFNEKISSLNAAHNEEKEKLTLKLEEATAELDDYKRTYGDIAKALLDAQEYAAQLKAKADDEYRAMLDRIRIQEEAKNDRLKIYEDGIRSIRQALAELSADVNAKGVAIEENCTMLSEEYNSEEDAEA